jgi:multidrug transporter EmrE-like cation transporter
MTIRVTQLLLILCIVEVFGDILLKKYADTNYIPYLIGGIVSYAFIVYLLILLFKKESVLYVNGLWDGISALIESLAVFFILKERFKNPRQYIGLSLIIVGIMLLKYDHQ